MNGLSICIPVYNFNALSAVKTLCKQIQSLDLKAEVLVVDDASSPEITDLANFKNNNYAYERLEQNIGRSKIRNYLAQKSKYSHILFIDGDSGIEENFLDHYLLALSKNDNCIIYGGTAQPKESIKTKGLRYNYSKKIEFKKANTRNKKPFICFKTNNFIVPKEIIKATPFNENLKKYGHEDTFFAYQMEQVPVKIIHIDNPVIHFDDSNNSQFIKKTKESIENLIVLYTEYPQFIEYSELLKFAKTNTLLNYQLSKKLAYPISKFFEVLAEKTSSTSFFQMFKLFYLTSIQ
ncbi:glycosyltransferase family 2 protein [Algibacter mikhailovii]|uniref:glycosyltransferase family 2 protein n=1 Tax=Algibacter mikhailovii TaxID=425498 RepID=UPI0024945DDB|nr:glycosyltransferase family 2 protein [Algibacter mikhailovii]